jgi:hypothetical protein
VKRITTVPYHTGTVALIVLPSERATDAPELFVKVRFLTEGENPEKAWQDPLAISSVLRTCPVSPSRYLMAIVGWVGLALPSKGLRVGWAEVVLLTMLYV